jgi:hypothetical protein
MTDAFQRSRNQKEPKIVEPIQRYAVLRKFVIHAKEKLAPGEQPVTQVLIPTKQTSLRRTI